MTVKVVAWDIPGGSPHRIIGTYDSVQITGTIVRDPDGEIIAEQYAATGEWYIGERSTKKRLWSDLTIEGAK